jgi:hypothetical protein
MTGYLKQHHEGKLVPPAPLPNKRGYWYPSNLAAASRESTMSFRKGGGEWNRASCWVLWLWCETNETLAEVHGEKLDAKL